MSCPLYFSRVFFQKLVNAITHAFVPRLCCQLRRLCVWSVPRIYDFRNKPRNIGSVHLPCLSRGQPTQKETLLRRLHYELDWEVLVDFLCQQVCAGSADEDEVVLFLLLHLNVYVEFHRKFAGHLGKLPQKKGQMGRIMAVSSTGLKWTVGLRAADDDFSVKDAVAEEFFEEVLELLVYVWEA